MQNSSILMRLVGLTCLAAALVASTPVRTADKRIVLIAGRPSHPAGMHEFRAGSMLLQKALSSVPGVTVTVFDDGMADEGRSTACASDDNAALENADAVLIFADGGKGHPAIQGERMQGARRARRERRRPWLRALRRRSAGRRARRGDAALDRRLLRDELVGEPDVEAVVREVPEPSDHARRQAVRDPRRVVLQHALDAPTPRRRRR